MDLLFHGQTKRLVSGVAGVNSLIELQDALIEPVTVGSGECATEVGVLIWSKVEKLRRCSTAKAEDIDREEGAELVERFIENLSRFLNWCGEKAVASKASPIQVAVDWLEKFPVDGLLICRLQVAVQLWFREEAI